MYAIKFNACGGVQCARSVHRRDYYNMPIKNHAPTQHHPSTHFATSARIAFLLRPAILLQGKQTTPLPSSFQYHALKFIKLYIVLLQTTDYRRARKEFCSTPCSDELRTNKRLYIPLDFEERGKKLLYGSLGRGS